MRRFAMFVGGVFSFFALSLNAGAQEHAPTLDVCRADAALWGEIRAEIDYINATAEKMSNSTPNRTEIAKLSLKEVNSRITEMVQCQSVDRESRDSYSKVEDFYVQVESDRWRAFIVRHNLYSQFEREDAEGKR